MQWFKINSNLKRTTQYWPDHPKCHHGWSVGPAMISTYFTHCTKWSKTNHISWHIPNNFTQKYTVIYLTYSWNLHAFISIQTTMADTEYSLYFQSSLVYPHPHELNTDPLACYTTILNRDHVAYIFVSTIFHSQLSAKCCVSHVKVHRPWR